MGRSEEQWKDLKTKITVAVIIGIIAACGYAIGPGLMKFVDHARKHKTEPWAPKWYYNVGRIYEATWRAPKAMEVYEDFWRNYSGDEAALSDLFVMIEDIKYDTAYPSLVPLFLSKNPNREWVGGPGAKPHPLMADVLMRLSKMEEERRQYQEARYYYSAVLYCFPSGTAAYTAAEQAKKRDLARGF